MAADAVTRRHFGNPLFREIHKNSWLTKIPNNDQKKRKERVWIVFCVHDDTDAFLEAYIDNKTAVLHKPEWFVPLNATRHISPTICPHEDEYEFVITLRTENVRLAAPSWDQMVDWVDSLRAKLVELKVLAPMENVYSKLGATNGSNVGGVGLLPTRDPTSPLPPPPAVPPALLPGIEQPAASPSHVLQQHTGQTRLDSTSTPTSVTIIQLSTHHQPMFTFPPTPTAPTTTAANNYDSVFSYNTNTNTSSTNGDSTAPSPQLAAYVLAPTPALGAAPTVTFAPPRPKTLREHQVHQLSKEMQHPGGVRLQLRRRDCAASIAFADVMGSVWICGWNQKDNPLLHSTLHIGDRIVSVEGIFVHSSSEVHQVLRTIEQHRLLVTVIIRRVPHGRVLLLHRSTEHESLGLVQEGNTATVSRVVSHGLAARSGLSLRAPTCDGRSDTKWVLTEINGRPLNLFFKDTEVKDRLNAVGRDISILVQPLDLVSQLKKQLKLTRNYKDYVLH